MTASTLALQKPKFGGVKSVNIRNCSIEFFCTMMFMLCAALPHQRRSDSMLLRARMRCG